MYKQIESEQRQHHEFLRRENERINVGMEHISKMAKINGCKITKDGNEWCCLWGENIQEGIVGFGKTPLDAMAEWAIEFGIK